MVTTSPNVEKVKPECFGQLWDPKVQSCRICDLSHDCSEAAKAVVKMTPQPQLPENPPEIDDEPKGQEEKSDTGEKESKAPTEEQLTGLIESLGFRPGSQAGLAIRLLTQEWQSRSFIQKEIIRIFGGKGTGGISALNKLVRGNAVEIQNLGRKKLYRINPEMWK